MSPFARRHPKETSVGAANPRAILAWKVNRAGDPGARSVTRRACAISSRARCSAFARALRSVTGLRPRKWDATCESRRVSGRGSLARGAATHRWVYATGTCSCRRVVGRKPSTRVRGSTARRVCPRVEFGCRSRRAKPRSRQALSPLATGRVDGDPAREDSQESERVQRHREPAPRWPSCGVGKAQAGRSKGRCGAKALDRRKAPRTA